MQLGPRVAAIGNAVPALELIAEHQQPGKGMQRHRQRLFPEFLIFIKGNGKFKDAVMQQDCCEHSSLHTNSTFSGDSNGVLGKENDDHRYYQEKPEAQILTRYWGAMRRRDRF